MESTSSPSASSSAAFFVTPFFVYLGCLAASSLLALLTYRLMLKFCLRRQHTTMETDIIQMQASQQMPIGVEQHVLNAIPVVSYSMENGKLLLHGDQPECVICLGELQEGDKVRSLPNCGHVFHVLCIDDWFLEHTSCPICRTPIAVTPIDTSMVDETSNYLEGPQNIAQFLDHDQEEQASGGDDSSNDARQSNVLLRHSVSLVLPMEGKQPDLMGLTRSLSMDHCFLIIDIPREGDKKGSKSSPSCSCSSLKGVPMENRIYGMRQLDRVSSRFLRSLSQMRIGQSV